MRHALLILLIASDGGLDLGLPQGARAALEGRWSNTPASFRPIALSLIADGCAAAGSAHPELRAEAEACVTQALARARRIVSPTTGDGLALTHLNLILGAHDALTGHCADEALHQSLSQRLARLSLADKSAHAPSYATRPQRWPADQAATLASLARYDRAHASSLAALPVARWTEVMERSTTHPTGLPPSEVTGTAGASAPLPRGCAQSYLARYVPEFAPTLAGAWWSAYREAFLVRPTATLAGFREWPPGVDRSADIDSGPIVMGIGTAASAFAIAGARASGDELLATQLETSAELLIAMGVGGASARSSVADSIRFVGRWQPRLLPSP